MSDLPFSEPPPWFDDAPPISEGDLPPARPIPEAPTPANGKANGKANGHAAHASAEWPQPKPLGGSLLPVPALDPSMIPPALRDWISDIALRSQAPIDYAAVAAIVAAGALIGRSIGIRPKRQDDWTVVPNLWGGAVGRPGIMKSPMLAEALRPLQRLASEAFQRFEEVAEKARFSAMIAKANEAKLEAEIKKVVAQGGDPESLREKLTKPDAAPTIKRYVVNDSTIEQLGQLLNENPRGLLLFRDELIGFFRTLDKEGHENDRAAYLEMWTGNGPPYLYDRVSRGTIRIEAPCIAILGGIQPTTLADYLRAATRAGQGDDGLIQRFQLFVYPDVTPEWKNIDQWPDSAAKKRAYDVYRRLDDLNPESVQAIKNDDDGTWHLHFSNGAQLMFDEWRAKLEQRIRNEGEHPAVSAHLAKFRSLLPSLSLIFHLIGGVSGSGGGPVNAFAADLAMKWCSYLEQHARRIYQSVTEFRAGTVHLLAAKIKAKALPSPFTIRQVLHADWAGLGDREGVSAALESLEENGWIRASKVTGTHGGRPKFEYHCSPHFWPPPSPPPVGG